MAGNPKAYSGLDALLGSMDTQEVITLNEQVEDLLEHPGWQVLSDLIRSGHDNVTNDIINGTLKSEAQYARLAGFGAGLEALEEIPRRIAHHAAERERQLVAIAEREAAESEG